MESMGADSRTRHYGGFPATNFFVSCLLTGTATSGSRCGEGRPLARDLKDSGIVSFGIDSSLARRCRPICSTHRWTCVWRIPRSLPLDDACADVVRSAFMSLQ